MENKIADKEQLSPLSASKLKTFENCSWLYWSNYHLKLPQDKNEGSKKGDCCHWVFELLIIPKHYKHYKKITKEGSILASKPIQRLVRLYMKKSKLADTQENWLQLDQMILVGLMSDFFIKDGVLVSPEYRFDILNEDKGFRIKGFMDKPFIVGDKIIIDDYKSSKKRFEGEEEVSNMQALIYSYAAKQIWPNLNPIVRFIFLQYPRNPIMEIKFEPDVLKGFEYYLSGMQEKVNVFTESDAKKHFAADENPPPGEFKGRILCGFAKFPGQLKKDGTKMWHCAYRFAYDYYAIKKDGKILYTVFDKKNVKLNAGEVIEFLHYSGCPRWKNSLDDMGSVPIKKQEKKTNKNVLDDF